MQFELNYTTSKVQTDVICTSVIKFCLVNTQNLWYTSLTLFYLILFSFVVLPLTVDKNFHKDNLENTKKTKTNSYRSSIEVRNSAKMRS